MLKIYKQTQDIPVKIGVFKSYADFIIWLSERQGTYFTIPPNLKSTASINEITCSGVLCTSPYQGFVLNKIKGVVAQAID